MDGAHRAAGTGTARCRLTTSCSAGWKAFGMQGGNEGARAAGCRCTERRDLYFSSAQICILVPGQHGRSL